MALTLFLLGCILVVAHTAETFLGFGSTLIALAFGVYLLPLNILLPMLVILGLLQSIWLVSRWFRYVDWRKLFFFILPLAAVGLLIGIISRGIANKDVLKIVLGVFIIVVSSAELALLYIRKTPGGRLHWYYRVSLLIGGGFFHGLFATGGPPIVYYANREFRDQMYLRATLSMLWLILNIGLLIGFLLGRQINIQILEMTAWVLPGFILGIILGSLIRVKEFSFKVLAHSLLFCAGMFLLIQTLGKT